MNHTWIAINFFMVCINRHFNVWKRCASVFLLPTVLAALTNNLLTQLVMGYYNKFKFLILFGFLFKNFCSYKSYLTYN